MGLSGYGSMPLTEGIAPKTIVWALLSSQRARPRPSLPLRRIPVASDFTTTRELPPETASRAFWGFRAAITSRAEYIVLTARLTQTAFQTARTIARFLLAAAPSYSDP